jgi:GST-like protein
VIQLYAFPTPNGVKVSIALEELGLPYEAHRVTLADTDVKSPGFLSLNPNNKIPAIIDPNGPGGAPIALWESGAILIYLAEKTGRLLGATEADKYQVLKWLMFQMGGVGPMFGQLGFFVKFAGAKVEDPRPRQRYINEAKRLLNVVGGCAGRTRLDRRRIFHRRYSTGALAGCARLLRRPRVWSGWSDLKNAPAYLDRFMERPAVQSGRNVPPREG